MTFRMIELSDFAVFGAWDGVLVAAFFVVAGILCRTLVRMMRKSGSKDPTLKTAYLAQSPHRLKNGQLGERTGNALRG